MRARWHCLRLDVLLLLFSLIVCIWLGTTNYSLNILVQEKEDALRQQKDTTQTHLLRVDKQLTDLHSHASTIERDYTSLGPKIHTTLKRQQDEVVEVTQKLTDTEKKLTDAEKKLTDTEQKLNEAKNKIGDLKKQVGDITKSIPTNNREHLAQIAFDWEDKKSSVRSLSILYVMDYFNTMARKENLTIEMIFVHRAESTAISSDLIITNNLVSEFKVVTSGSLETMLNEGSRGAKGKYLLFVPILASKSTELDIELAIDVPKMLAAFKDPDVGMVGGIVVNKENNTFINAGIDFARTKKDAVTPFERFIGAGLHYPKKTDNTPCVSKTGMMIDRKLFASIGGFSGSYSESMAFSFTQLLADSELCLNVLALSKKIPESSIKTRSLAPPSFYAQSQFYDLLVKFDATWAFAVRRLIEEKKELHDFMLVWDLYCGCTGVNVEAINYLVALENKLDVGAVAGENCWCGGFPTYVQESLIRISSRVIGPKVDVWVSHKPPDKYPSFPYTGLVEVKERPFRVIGRSMSETDTIKAKWVQNSEKVDEIWVPTEFHKEVFAVSGIDSKKLVVIEESLDTTLYDPEHTLPLPLDPRFNSAFKFLSVFKWEARKGWDVLLQAYFEEFVGDVDNVVLVLQTYLYGEKNPRDRKKVENKIKSFAESLGLKKQLPPVLVLTDELPELQMPPLYKACDAFVLPTRGEGWGLPVMESMSMALPSIVTNWSGPTQFTTKDTSYLLSYDELETVPKTFEGGSGIEKWAKPSLSHLKELMRDIYANPKKAQEVGKRARRHIVENFDRDTIAEKMVQRLQAIHKTVRK